MTAQAPREGRKGGSGLRAAGLPTFPRGDSLLPDPLPTPHPQLGPTRHPEPTASRCPRATEPPPAPGHSVEEASAGPGGRGPGWEA